MSAQINSNGNGMHAALNDQPALITGGAGFIGSNLAHRLLRQGRRVVLFDNLSRAGVEQNARWLEQVHGRRVQLIVGDVRDKTAVARAVAQAGEVFHLAAQVAVTTSLADPRSDFETNVCGTFHLLEALRALDHPPPLVYTSTNKVYGNLEHVPLREHGARYEPVDDGLRRNGVGERHSLDFHTPYGCSKGAAEQYVLDYARSFGRPAVVFRMSCIYGPHQFGTEDQGWVAHFLIRALDGQPITIYGDGRQVRDILYVDDLVDALALAQRHMPQISGEAFNIGGGPERAVSLAELLATIGQIRGRAPRTYFEESRTGDQRYYVSDCGKFREATGWSPKVSPAEGVRALCDWLLAEREPVGVHALAGLK